MRTTSRMIAALALALGVSGAAAQTPPASGEGASAAPPSAPVPPAPAPATPSAPAPAASAPSQQGTPATVLDTQDYESLLGRSVRSAGGDELGRVIDVIVDKDGHPRAAIIDFGGFLGVGTRKIAVDWRALRFTADGKDRRLSVALTRNQVRVSPEYKTGEPIVVLGPGSSAGAPPEADPAAAASQAAAPAQPPAQLPAQAPAAGGAPAPASAPQPASAAPPSPAAPEKAPDK